MDKLRVIFIGMGNSVRSQMAEAFLRQYADNLFEVYSAGWRPKPIHLLTYKTLSEIGISMNGQSSKSAYDFIGKYLFHYVITVCNESESHLPKQLMGVREHLHWHFDDPSELSGNQHQKLAYFRTTRDLIDKRIRSWLQEQGYPLPGGTGPDFRPQL